MGHSNRTPVEKDPTSRQRRALLPYLTLALGMLFTFLVSYYFSRLAETQDHGRFRSAVQEIDDRVKTKVLTSIALLRAGTGLFNASENVTQREFDRFVEQIELSKNYPGIQGIGFSLRIRPEEKAAVIAQMQKSGVRNFNIWPDYARQEYHSITFLYPPDSRNKLAIGFDMMTEDVRRAAMEHARDTGAPTASGRVVLVQEGDADKKQYGFLIYAPVYRNSAPTGTEDERRGALVGFVYSPMRVDDFLDAVTADKKGDLIIRVYDGEGINPNNLMHQSEENPTNSTQPKFFTADSLNIGEHHWTLSYATKPSFELSSSRAFLPYIFSAGVVLSLLLFGLTRSEVRARANAERGAANLRESEATIRQTLGDRALAEEALRESEESYRELVENANDIVYVLDSNGKILSINKAAEGITGFPQNELLQMNLTDMLSEESRADGEKMITKRSGTERANFEVDIVSKTGRHVTLEISSKPIFKGGDSVGIQGIARDISTRRRAEEALREADQRALSEYERLLERISGLAQALGTSRELNTIFRALRDFTDASVPCDGFFVSLYDSVQNVRTACYGWGDNKEIDVSELPPMPVTSVGPNSRAVRTGQVVITDDYMKATRGSPLVIIGPDDGLRPQSSMAVPMAVMGRIIGTIEVQSYEPLAYRHEHVTAMSMAANLTAVAIENVRLLKRESDAREAAEDSNRLKDEFLATVSHELRTPLTAILGWSRLLEGGALSDKVSKQAIETIWRNAKSQAQIIDDILDVSRIITGNLYLDLHPIELNPVVESAINVVRPTADAKGISIDVELDSAPAVVSGDGNRLQQVIWNLVSNAVKFTETGGRVNVKLCRLEGMVEITVADTGQGISRDFLPFVFDRFRQADSTTTRQHGGLGLGLAIARHLVEIHGGAIHANSSGEGCGATFTIKLPALVETPRNSVLFTDIDREKEALTTRELLTGLRVLIVDDDADTLQLMATALSSRQANVTAVSTAGEALDAFQTSKPDVLVSDIAMPEEDGYDLITKLRAMEENENTPAVAITAYAKDEDRVRALSSGFQIYLAKPIELSELISAVARAARREL